MKTIVSQFEYHVRHNPSAVAVEMNGKELSYEELNNYANYVAKLLVEKGVKESAIVAIYGLKSIEMIASTLAILKLNSIYMPVESGLPTTRIQSMIKNANVKYIVTFGNSDLEQELFHIEIIRLNYEYFDKNKKYDNFNKLISVYDPAYIIHTSGSTGMPKGIIVPHGGVIRLLIDTNYIYLNPSDKILFHSNTSFDAGIFEIWSALLLGGTLVISPYMTGDLSSVFKLCQEKNITILLLATGLFHIFSSMELGKLPKLRYLIVGGDIMHSAAAKMVLQKNKKLKIINGYGPAENSVFTTCLVMEKISDVGQSISIGKPINGTQVYLLDENFNKVQPGEVGEIYTAGLGLALGYLNDPILTAGKFLCLPHIAANTIFYRTGDMAKLLPSGDYEFIGRRDNQVKIRGFRIELTEIEREISSLTFVEDVCVCIIQSEKENKKIAAFVKLNNNDSNISIDKLTIVSHLKNKLPNYCIPTYLEVSKDFPLTLNGKINRKLIKEHLLSKFNLST